MSWFKVLGSSGFKFKGVQGLGLRVWDCCGLGGIRVNWLRAGCSRFRDLGVLGFVSWFKVLGSSGFKFKGVQGLGLRVWDCCGLGGIRVNWLRAGCSRFRDLGVLGFVSWFKVLGSSGFKFKGVQGLGLRVWDCCGLGGIRVNWLRAGCSRFRDLGVLGFVSWFKVLGSSGFKFKGVQGLGLRVWDCCGLGGIRVNWLRAGCSRFRDLGVLGFVSWFKVLGSSGFKFKGVQGLGLRVWDCCGLGGIRVNWLRAGCSRFRDLGVLGFVSWFKVLGSSGFKFKGVQGLGLRVWDCCGLGGIRVNWLRAGCSRFRDLGVLGFVSWFKVLGSSGFKFKGVQGLGLRVWDCCGLGGIRVNWLRAGCSRFRDLGVLGFVSWFKVLGSSGFKFKGVQGLGLRVWDCCGLGGIRVNWLRAGCSRFRDLGVLGFVSWFKVLGSSGFKFKGVQGLGLRVWDCCGLGGIRVNWLRAGCSRFRDLGVLGFVSWFKVLGSSGFRFKGVQGLGLRAWDRWGLGGC